MIKEGEYKNALTELTKAKKETEETLQRLNEMKEALTKAQVSEAFALATKYSEEARTAYWNTQNAKIENEYLKETFENRVDAAYYNNCVSIALAAKYKKDVEVGDAQIKQLKAAAKELNERAAIYHLRGKQRNRKTRRECPCGGAVDHQKGKG